MSKRSILVPLVALAMIFGAASAFANSLAVTPAAALGGSNFGLAVTLDGTTNPVYVAENSAVDELVYRAEFRVNHNNMTLDPGSAHAILVTRKGPAPVVNNIRIFLKKIGSDYKITVRAKKEGAGTANCGKTTFGGAGLRIGIEWVAASATGLSDGECRLFRNGVEFFENTNVSNFGMEVDAVRFGAPLGDVEATTVGDFYLDDFSSFRTLAP